MDSRKSNGNLKSSKMILKKTLLLLCIIANASLLMAQDNKRANEKKHIIYAPVIGLNYAGLTGTDYGGSYKYIFGGVAGFVVNVVDFEQFFSLRAEVNVSMQGAKFPISFSGMGTDATAFYHLTYLNFPMEAEVSFTDAI
jgi:hypothetical protein